MDWGLELGKGEKEEKVSDFVGEVPIEQNKESWAPPTVSRPSRQDGHVGTRSPNDLGTPGTGRADSPPLSQAQASTRRSAAHTWFLPFYLL